MHSISRTQRLTPCQHFNNEPYEIAQYDRHLKSYEQSSLKIATSLAFLNSGQNVIFSTGLTLIMFLAAQGVVNGARSVFWHEMGLVVDSSGAQGR
jgi:ABC-type transport system involved in Fe-S cluster assembly fused permease/ATPase subunit